MKKLIYITTLVLSTFSLSAQQEAMFSHYTFNQLSINPAYAGTKDGVNLIALHRSQWVAFKGAPITQVISGHVPIKGKNFGVGLNINNDRIGPTRNTGIAGNFSYKLKIGDIGKLALGLKAAVNFISVSLADLTVVNTNDVAFSSNISSRPLPNFGVGAYYYTDKYYAGVSIPQLLQNGFSVNSPTSSSIALSSNKRHYYLIGGATFDLNSNLKIEPSAFMKITEGAPVSIEITTLFKYRNRFWAGPSYRYGDALGILLGLEVVDNFELGYAFDWSFTNRTAAYNGGSHEVMLKYTIPSSNTSREKFN